MHAFTAIAALLFQTAVPSDSGSAARNPAYARDGRLAVSVRGDLWIVSKRSEWTRVTSGGAWDREPSWTADGTAIVFSSDRAGNFDLGECPLARRERRRPERVTTSPLPEGEPSVAPDGRIFLSAADSAPRRCGLVRRTAPNMRHEGPRGGAMAERVGRWIAAGVCEHCRRSRKLHVRTLDGARDTTVSPIHESSIRFGRQPVTGLSGPPRRARMGLCDAARRTLHQSGERASR